MRYTAVALATIIASVIFAACSASRPVARTEQRQLGILIIEQQAWNAARRRLHSMCPAVPRSESELTEALKVNHGNGCYVRLAKDSYLPMIDDWHWHWLPPYRTVVAIHDEELRRRVTPRYYEEYMSGLNRYLAKKTDDGEISPGQFRYVFNAGWNWLIGKMQKEQFLLQHNLLSPEGADMTTPGTLNAVAGELATVATLALAVSAQDKDYQPAPATCYAHPAAQRSYTIQCY